VIDTIAIMVTGTILLLLFNHLESFVIAPLTYFLYYFIMEVTLCQTLGKLVTKTKVVSVKGKRPNVLHILIRTVLRFQNPVDVFSYLMGNEQGVHDVLSRTRLVKVDSKT
jgi:uncharacterized RDD family membrane protein YckC